MGMVVRTNIAAMNANRNLNKNNNAVGKSLEKLSSGFKINRAGDDASGLAISEKMKAQIKALDTASANCEDGISLIQTAEGYMSEVHDMLNRMVELAEKSANGINEDSGKTGANAYGVDASGKMAGGTDRSALQAEMDQLAAEIDRIAITANFNGNKLFNGAMDGHASVKGKVIGNDGKVDADLSNKALTLQIGETSSYADRLTVNIRKMSTDVLFADMKNSKYKVTSNTTGTAAATDITKANTKDTITKTMYTQKTEGVSKDSGKLSSVENALTINISDQTYAATAADALKDVINDVSSQRADLGAMQNRLEYTVNNLNTASENMNSANSRIRDTDMAKEMMKYTSQNVLTQAAQSMLAQANTKTQNVLQLLQ
jgi:flagellin